MTCSRVNFFFISRLLFGGNFDGIRRYSFECFSDGEFYFAIMVQYFQAGRLTDVLSTLRTGDADLRF